MEKRQVINIVNFIRDCEPRDSVDLVLTVRKEIELMQQYGLRGTFLLQYDALIDPVYTDMLKALDPSQFELGVWFEVVQPLVETVGLPWRGRFPWDWHVHCGFSMGYTKQQREQLLDELYGKFREIFGYYPRVFGSWFFDSHTARYVSDKYGVDDLALAHTHYVDIVADKHLVAHLSQAGKYEIGEHRLHFKGRAGEENDHVFAVVDENSGGGARFVWNWERA